MHTFSRHARTTVLYIASWLLMVILRKSSIVRVSEDLPRVVPFVQKRYK